MALKIVTAMWPVFLVLGVLVGKDAWRVGESSLGSWFMSPLLPQRA